MPPKLTDDAVAHLPLSEGRNELLEEIMRTPVRDTARDPLPASPARVRRTRWLVPLAAAASIAVLASVPVWWGGDDQDPTGTLGAGTSGTGTPGTGTAGTVASQAPATGLHHVVLEAPGWTAGHVDVEKDGSGEIGYDHLTEGDGDGLRGVQVRWAPADSYESYLEDREHITQPPSAGEKVEVLGLESRMWAYSPDDHTTIRPVENGFWLEVRGTGMDKAAYVDLLGALRLVDQAAFEASLPQEYVSRSERQGAVAEMVAGIREFTDPVLPRGGDPAGITSAEVDRYQLGADVAGDIACAWLIEYSKARQVGDDGRAALAVDALAGSRQWPILLEMDERGDYPEVVWEYADLIAEGERPEDFHFKTGLGCGGH